MPFSNIQLIFPVSVRFGFVIIMFLVFPFCSGAQNNITLTDCPRSFKQADIWYFGEKAGIDFRSGNATPLLDQNVMTSYKSSAVISDSLGNLLFFTDGKRVWDRNFNLMTNANALLGYPGVSQPCIIVPAPGNPYRYYIFTIDFLKFNPDNSYTTSGLTYTVIDMTKWNGLGDAILDSMNIQLLPAVSQKLTAVKHGNKDSKDIWIIVHQWDSDAFYAYLLTSSGLSSAVISNTGSVHSGGYDPYEQANAYGYLKASPDGSKIALAMSGVNKIELFDFDNLTGKLSNPQSYSTTDPNISPYGIEFSSDSKMLYTTLFQLFGNGPPSAPSRIYQFDVRQGLTNPVLLDSIQGIRTGGLQLATDGRIYISRMVGGGTWKDSLDVIYNPTRPGLSCNLNRLNLTTGNRFSLNGRKVVWGLPNFIQSYFDYPLFTYDSICHGDITGFRIINKANIDQVLWEFGDGATSTDFDPVHIFPQPGNYMVKLTETFNGENFRDSVQITIFQLPNVELGDTILLYSGASINLHAGGGFQEYVWSNNSIDSIINVNEGGDYWVRVKDERCCYNSDTVFVNLFKYYVPSAFTPNGDGKNDIFRVIGQYKNIQYTMYIYNRWGQLVFESHHIDEGWDGTMAGQPAMSDTYVWTAYIKFLGQDILTSGDVVFKGTVTLIK